MKRSHPYPSDPSPRKKNEPSAPTSRAKSDAGCQESNAPVGNGYRTTVLVAAAGALQAGARASARAFSAAAHPPRTPRPMPSASGRPPMSGGYAIGDGSSAQRVRGEHLHQTRTTRRNKGKHRTRCKSRRTLPRTAERVYAWNTGDTPTIRSVTQIQPSFFARLLTSAICTKVDEDSYQTSSNITDVLRVNSSLMAQHQIIQVLVKFHIVIVEIKCQRGSYEGTNARIRLNTVPNSHLERWQ